MTIDTLKIARRLREAGFSEPQAEAVVAAFRKVPRAPSTLQRAISRL